MAQKYMSYTRDVGGCITRTHHVVAVSDDDARAYDARETLWGWPEPYVFWRVMADGSAVGIAPMTQRVLRGLTNYRSPSTRTARAASTLRSSPHRTMRAMTGHGSHATPI